MVEMRGENDVLVRQFRVAAAEDTNDIRTRYRFVVGLAGESYLGT